MLKKLSATECGDWTKEFIQKWFSGPLDSFRGTHSLEGSESFIQRRQKNKHLKLLANVKEDLSRIVYHPWFYVCNKNRYPAWEGQHDTRVI